MNKTDANSDFSVTEVKIQNKHLRLVDAYRHYAHVKWKKPLYAKSRQMLAQGRYPFERAWYTEYEITTLKSILSKRYRAMIFDMGLIFSAAILFNLLLYVVIFFVIDAT
ncbi:MAG: hypothetical protein PHH11_09255 [Methylomonas sp.]|nr:hypothetical protein [Methylomonas sp.]